jgi:hypothetical protein
MSLNYADLLASLDNDDDMHIESPQSSPTVPLSAPIALPNPPKPLHRPIRSLPPSHVIAVNHTFSSPDMSPLMAFEVVLQCLVGSYMPILDIDPLWKLPFAMVSTEFPCTTQTHDNPPRPHRRSSNGISISTTRSQSSTPSRHVWEPVAHTLVSHTDPTPASIKLTAPSLPYTRNQADERGNSKKTMDADNEEVHSEFTLRVRPRALLVAGHLVPR